MSNKRTWQKRAEFFAYGLLGPLGGEIHYERWPERSAFGKTRFSRPQATITGRRRR